MQTDYITGAIEFLCAVNGLHVVFEHRLIGAICIVGVALHTKTFGDTSHITADVTEGVDTKFLALQFGTGCTIIEVTNGKYHQSECQFSHRIRVLSRGVHRHHFVGSRGLKVNVIVAGTCANNNLKLFGGIKHFCVHNIRTDNNGVRILNSVQELRFVGIFL